MASIIDDLRDYVRSAVAGEEEYRVDGYVLERRDPEPNPRVATYDDRVRADDVAAEADLPAGTYVLRELKPSGMAGDVVWTAELPPEDDS